MGDSGFDNPIVGGVALIRPAIQSPNYVAGSTGWSINADGTAEFNGATFRGTIIVGNGTTNTIIIDNTRDAIFVYNSTGKLIISIAPNSGTDSFGNAYNAGITNYVSGDLNTYANLNAAQIRFGLNDTGNTPADINPTIAGSVSASPALNLVAPTNNAALETALILLYGVSNDGTIHSSISMNSRSTRALPLYLAGNLIWEDASTSPGLLPETWHNATLLNGWTNGTYPAQYRRHADGMVQLRGWIQGGTTTDATPLLNLPALYRDTVTQYAFPAVSPLAPTQRPLLVSHPSGNVQIFGISGLTASVDLAPMTYMVNSIP